MRSCSASRYAQQEVQRGFPQPVSEHLDGPAQLGEYQIGDVHARSCCFMGTSSLIFTPKRTWSYAVQRGVGISIARA